jgi:hypothetical protein
MKVFVDFGQHIFLEVMDGFFITLEKGKIVAKPLSKNGLRVVSSSPHYAAERFLASRFPKTRQAETWLNRCLTFPEGANMYYIVSNNGEIVKALAKKKEAEQEFSALTDEQRLEHGIYGKADALNGLSMEALITMHNDLVPAEQQVGDGDVLAEELVPKVWGLMEATHNPKVAEKAARKAAKEPTERRPRTDWTGRSLTKGEVEFTGRDGTWTAFMVATALASSTTDEAIATVAAHPDYGTAGKNKVCDFPWMQAKGYIVVGPSAQQ